jgi:hypothetical protein
VVFVSEVQEGAGGFMGKLRGMFRGNREQGVASDENASAQGSPDGKVSADMWNRWSETQRAEYLERVRGDVAAKSRIDSDVAASKQRNFQSAMGMGGAQAESPTLQVGAISPEERTDEDNFAIDVNRKLMRGGTGQTGSQFHVNVQSGKDASRQRRSVGANPLDLQGMSNEGVDTLAAEAPQEREKRHNEEAGGRAEALDNVSRSGSVQKRPRL